MTSTERQLRIAANMETQAAIACLDEAKDFQMSLHDASARFFRGLAEDVADLGLPERPEPTVTVVFVKFGEIFE